jgi:hypothetical protein
MKRLAILVALILATAGVAAAQTVPSERWLHVRVESSDPRGDLVRVNFPLSLAEKVLPAINHDQLHDGKISFHGRLEGLDLRALLAAVRESRDGEFVTVQSREGEVRVAKEQGILIVHARDTKGEKDSRVEVRVPMTVVNALVSADGNALDLVAGVRALAAHGDAELVSVKDRRNTVRVWVDSKNTSD